MDSLILASKTSDLTQGMFIGSVSNNFDERIHQKIFHAEIVVDTVNVSAEMKSYLPIPMIVNLRKKMVLTIFPTLLKQTISVSNKSPYI